MFAIVFAHASLVVSLSDRAAFDAAVEVLSPFADESEARRSGLSWDDYATVSQAIEGQEMSIRAAMAAGILDENGDATSNATVYRAA